MIVSAEHKFAFQHIPRTGGTTMTRLLAPYVRPNDPCTGYGWQNRFHRGRMHRKLGSKALRHVKDDYHFFTIVRNPYSRVISLWHSFMFRHPQGSKFERLAPFCEMLAKDKVTRRFAPQARFLSGFKELLTKIYRFEDAPEVFLMIMADLGLPKPAKVPHDNGRPAHQVGNGGGLTPEVAEHVYAVYREDFELFGYEEDSWMEWVEHVQVKYSDT